MSDASTRGRSNRLKGQRGERELANELSDLLGITLKRRVRNHSGDDDIVGLDGFSPEVKNCKELCLATWWKQAVTQRREGTLPVLFYKIPRKGWRALINLSHMFGGQITDSLDYTADMSLPSFAMYYRETLSK